MEEEICDIYERVGYKQNRWTSICKHFTGNKDNKKHIDNCKYHCSYYAAKRQMQEISNIDETKC